MKKVFLLCFSFLLTLPAFSQTWDGGGDNTSWDDPLNWDNDMVPAAGDIVTINSNAFITGTVTDNPGRITINGGATVTLDLDITIGDGVVDEHGLVIGNNCTLNLGSIGNNRSITINASSTKNGIAMWAGASNQVLNIIESTEVEVSQSQNGIAFFTNSGQFNNGGTFRVSGASNNAINHTGTGTITNDGSIFITSSSTDGIKYQSSAGPFINNGGININGPVDDCIEVGSTAFENNGAIDLTQVTSGVFGSRALEVLSGGRFTNNAGADLRVTGAGGSSDRAIRVESAGTLVNSGRIDANNGGNNGDVTINVVGTITNEACGIIDLAMARLSVGSGGVLTNAGYIVSTYVGGVGVLVNTGANGTNRAFYSYSNGSSNLFAGGNGTKVDNGIDVDVNSNITVDATFGCTVNLGISEPYSWENLSMTSVGMNDGAGDITFDSGVFDTEDGNIIENCQNIQYTINNISGDCSTLPVELIFFNATKANQSVDLAWSTASEINNNGFEIQKSANGYEWEKIGFVKGQGTTFEVQNYAFNDATPILGDNYYRLKQIDFDGAFEFSPIVLVNFAKGSGEIKVFPNPSNGIFTIDMPVIDADGVNVDVHNALGQFVKTTQITASNQQVSLEGLDNGTYFLRIATATGFVNHVVVKY